MVNVTLSISEDVKREMEMFPEINWSEIARIAIKKRIMILKKIKEFSRHSELTEEDAIEIGRKINESLTKKQKR